MILTNATQIPDAATADLLETYNALTGESVKKFASRAVGQRRVEMAMLAAIDRSAHAGVPVGVAPTPKPWPGVAPIESKPAEPEFVPDEKFAFDENPFKPGTLAHGLWNTTNSQKPIERAATQKRPRGAKPQFQSVWATGAGVSKPQPGSVRAAVLKHITEQPNKTCSLEALDAAFKMPTRGYVQKLLEKNHLKIVEAA